MLVLSRKVGEYIQIGPDIRVMLIRADGGKARIGIEAPPAVAIVREEIPALESAAAEAHREMRLRRKT